MEVILFILLGSIFVSMIGKYKGIGFWRTLIFCILLTPFIGFIFVLTYKNDYNKFISGKYNKFKRTIGRRGY